MRYSKSPKYIKTSILSMIAISFLIVMASFNTSSSESLKSFGFLSLVLLLTLSCFVLFYFLVKTYKIPRDMINILALAIILLSIYLIAVFIDSFSTRGVIVYIQLILVMVFFACISFVKWNERKIGVISSIVALFILFNFIVYAASGFPFPFKSFAGNVNVFSALMFFLAFFPLLYFLLIKNKASKLVWFIIICINLILMIVGQARSIWLALLISIFIFLFWNRISQTKFIFYSLFWITIITLIAVTFLYPLAANHPDALLWNQYVRQYTGANLFSGREDFWLLLIEAIMQKPLLGYGASATPGHFLPIGLSSHNLYIQIALQAGLTGLGLIWLLLFNIWKLFYYGKNNLYVRLAGSFFIAMMIYQVFEVSLTQNNLAVGLILWFIMGIGVSKSLEEKWGMVLTLIQ